MKKVVFGMVLGFILSSFTFMFAATTLKVTDNKFPILKNGVTAKVGAKNINGSTYLKLRDVATLLGVDIKFENKKIYISTTPSNKTSDGQIAFYIDKVKCVKYSDIQAKMQDAGINATISEPDSTISVSKGSKKASSKYIVILGEKYIPADFYEASIIPMY